MISFAVGGSYFGVTSLYDDVLKWHNLTRDCLMFAFGLVEGQA